MDVKIQEGIIRYVVQNFSSEIHFLNYISDDPFLYFNQHPCCPLCWLIFSIIHYASRAHAVY